MRTLEIRRLGRVAYADALALQRALVEERQPGRAEAERGDRAPAQQDRGIGAPGLINDVLLLLEHPHVVTLGVRGDGGRSHILANPDTLGARGVEVHEAGRGGGITYHGPGQIVGYPIVDLRPDRCDVHRYVRDLEEVMIRACADYGISAGRIKGMTGAWVGTEKVGAIGVRIARWVTSHGFALNVANDLAPFDLIVPCGIRDHGVTSLSRLLGREIAVEEAAVRLAAHVADVFDLEMVAS
jgi:lipoyl(octanoyl) transferase